MRGFFYKAILIIFGISFLTLFSICWAEADEEKGWMVGGFQWGGAIELGYRFTDIDGSEDRYRETVNLKDGLKLFELSLWGKNPDAGKGLVDSFKFSGRDIGDPFPSLRLEVKKNKLYDFNASFRQYQYFYNREDNFFLTDNHDFNSKINTGALSLTLFPKEDLQFNIGYRHWERDGNADVPRLFYPYPLPQDLNEGLNEYYVSVNFPVAGWDFFIKQGFWNFYSQNKIEAQVPLYYEDRNENMNTYVSTLKVHKHFGERWDFDGAYIFAHSNGWAQINTIPAIGISPGDGDTRFNTHIAELGLSYLIRKDLILHMDYRFHTLNQDGLTNTDPFLSPTGVDGSTNYNLKAHTGTLQLEYLPRENLTVRAGYQFQYQDIVETPLLITPPFTANNNPTHTTQWVHGWVASADWKPYKFLTFFGEYKGSNTSDPYTWISPENSNVAKVRVKYDTPIKSLSLKGTFLWTRRVNPDQEYRVDAKDFIFTLTYQPIFLPRLTFDGSVTYENIGDSKNIYNIVPSAFQPVIFDSDALIYTSGISYEGIYKGLGARVYGSYAKTWKENSQRYADAGFSIWYKNKWITPILSVQRTYLNDKVTPQNSFDANLLTFSLRKEF